MNKTPFQESLVYSYGLMRPSFDDEAKIFSHLRLANHYYNFLLQVEKEARSLYIKEVSKVIPEWAELNEDIATLQQSLEEKDEQARLSKAGKAKKADILLVSELKEIKDSLKRKRNERKELLSRYKDKLDDAKQAANELRNEGEKAARLYFGPQIGGLCWRTTGSYSNAARQATKAPNIKFKRFERKGLLLGQLCTEHVPTTDVWSSGCVSIKKIDPAVYYLPRGERKKASRTEVVLRLNSSTSVTFKMIMHRPLPNNASVSQVRLLVGELAGVPTYKLLFTVGLYTARNRKLGQGVVGLDIGWAKEPSEDEELPTKILAGALSAGTYSELITLDTYKIREAESAQSRADTAFDSLKQAHPEFVPFKNQARVFYSTKNREEKSIKDWRTQYRHRKYVDHLRHDFQQTRLHYYRNLAAKLASKYEYVAVENIAVSGMVQQVTVGRSESKARFNYQAKLAATYLLKQCLVNAGLKLIEVDAAYTSQTCFVCGAVDAASRKSRSTFGCTSCGHTDHADMNAAKNIRLRGERLLAQQSL